MKYEDIPASEVVNEIITIIKDEMKDWGDEEDHDRSVALDTLGTVLGQIYELDVRRIKK